MDTNKSKKMVRILMKENNYQEISQKEYMQRILSAREDERKMIARNIHDHLGQMLTVLSFDLVRIIKMSEKEHNAITNLASDSLINVETILDEIQEISMELRPTILDNLGFRAAIECKATEFQTKAGIECQLVCKPCFKLNDEHLATNIFRIFQELLINVARHSMATRVNIDFEIKNENVILVITDNGRGITADEVSNVQSIGILGIKERVSHSNGNVKFTGTPGKGTIVTVIIPIHC